MSKVIYLSILLFLLFKNAHGNDSIKVCFSLLPPWKMLNDNNFEGPGAEIAISIATRLGKKVEFSEMPFKRGLYYLKHGEFDLMTGLLRNSEREKYLVFIDPPYKTKSNKAFYLLKDGNVKLEKYEDLYSLAVGTQNAVSYFQMFDTDRNIRKHSVKKIRQNVLMLVNKRIDTFIATDSSADYIIKSMGYQNNIVKSSFGFYETNPVYIGISKKSPLNNPETIAVIRKMITSGEIDRIIVNFFKEKGIPVPDYK